MVSKEGITPGIRANNNDSGHEKHVTFYGG